MVCQKKEWRACGVCSRRVRFESRKLRSDIAAVRSPAEMSGELPAIIWRAILHGTPTARYYRILLDDSDIMVFSSRY